jgi:cell shape-determining protein MreC
MIYPQRDNRRKRKKLVTLTAILAGVILLITILNVVQPALFTPIVQGVGRPILEARGGFLGGLGATWRFLHTQGVLVAENSSLKQKLALTAAIQTERDYYKQQNAELLRRAGRIESDKKLVLAQIISKPGFSPYDTMIIDVGLDGGLKQGDRVLADGEIILGEVSQAFAHTATVLLYSTSDHETTVLIGTSSIQAAAIGKGGGTFEVKLPRNAGVRVGDSVTLASTTSKILGTIQVINTSPTDSFERALFKNAVDVGTLTFIMVEKQ